MRFERHFWELIVSACVVGLGYVLFMVALSAVMGCEPAVLAQAVDATLKDSTALPVATTCPDARVQDAGFQDMGFVEVPEHCILIQKDGWHLRCCAGQDANGKRGGACAIWASPAWH